MVLLHRKHRSVSQTLLRYLHKTNTSVPIILSAVKQAKSHLSSTIICRIILVYMFFIFRLVRSAGPLENR